MKKTWKSLNLGITHFLFLYIAILVIMPQRGLVYPIVIWLGMIILSGLVIHYYWNKKSTNQLVTRLRKSHRKTQSAALFSSLLFLLTCISFKVIDYISLIIPNALIFMTTLLIAYTILSHLKSFDNKEKNIIAKVKLGVKYSWVIVTLISYYLARSLISNSFDIPFDTTFNKLMTAVTALLFIFIFYYAIYFICTPYLTLIIPQVKKVKSTPCCDINYSMSVFAPLFFIGYISYFAFSVQTFSIIKFGYGFAMEYDTRDTFFCNNKYMWLNEHPKARFMFISDGNYRAFIPHHDDFTISRLTCTNSEPYYSLVIVKDKKDFMLDALNQRAEMLAIDLKTAISPDAQ
ncbi:TPA: hypothetical protein VCC33_004629 [Kluyvera cryocrescens]|nr:hypothetical protein [Kluyvera cryocrescens]